MNLTLRVQTNERSFIVKQARPWVEKYSHIEAPIERALMEGQFYQIIEGSQAGQMMPQLIYVDKTSYILVMEDLGEAKDFMFLYETEKNISSDELDQLTSYLATLHCNFTTKKCKIPLANKNMRKLNYEHMYNIPFTQGSMDLNAITSGLTEVAREYQVDTKLVQKIHHLGKLYLEDGNTLLHGDYYPGSWLITDNKIKVIDPEFCFFGMVEFDMGVFVGHLILAQQPRSYVLKFLAQYKKHHNFNRNLVFQFAGAEIMRRLLGVAQLPITYNLAGKKELLDIAYKFIMTE